MSKLINFQNKQDKKKNTDGSLQGGTLYDANKSIMSNFTPMSELEITALYPKFEDWFNMIIDTYAMLLCHDLRDYTIFHLYEKENKNPPAVATKEFFGCLTDRGQILSIDLNQDNAWEIWLKINDEPYCYYLFRYDEAVIEC